MVVPMLRKLLWLLVGPSLVILAGCGSKCSVSGRVTLGGQPVESGFITFFPADDKGQSASGEIVHGEYSIDTLTPGKKRIFVNITDQTAGTAVNTTKSRDEANAERMSKLKRKSTGSKKPTGGGITGNDKIVEVGSGSQKIDIPLEKAATSK
jgi:hypothetical protein